MASGWWGSWGSPSAAAGARSSGGGTGGGTGSGGVSASWRCVGWIRRQHGRVDLHRHGRRDVHRWQLGRLWGAGGSHTGGAAGGGTGGVGGTGGQAGKGTGGLGGSGTGSGGTAGGTGSGGSPPTSAGLVNTYDGARTTTVSFDSTWKFHLGDVTGAQATTFDDSSWTGLDVPHDWSISLAVQPELAGRARGGGYLDGGIGWYRKTFTLPASSAGQKVFVQFDGVYMDSTV